MRAPWEGAWELRISLLHIYCCATVKLVWNNFFSDCCHFSLMLRCGFCSPCNVLGVGWRGDCVWVGGNQLHNKDHVLASVFFFPAAKQRLVAEERSMAKITALRTKPFTWPWGDAITAYQDSSGNVTNPLCVWISKIVILPNTNKDRFSVTDIFGIFLRIVLFPVHSKAVVRSNSIEGKALKRLFSPRGRSVADTHRCRAGLLKTVVTFNLYLVGFLTAVFLACHGSVRGCRSHGFAQRAYRSHILLSVRPRQAPGLGRMFTMEGVSLLPCAVDRAQTADRWWV